MTTHPEKSVLDAIDGLEQDEIGELVRWQLEEGARRGEYPAPSEAAAARDDQFTQRYHLPAAFDNGSPLPRFEIGWGGSSSSD